MSDEPWKFFAYTGEPIFSETCLMGPVSISKPSFHILKFPVWFLSLYRWPWGHFIFIMRIPTLANYINWNSPTFLIHILRSDHISKFARFQSLRDFQSHLTSRAWRHICYPCFSWGVLPSYLLTLYGPTTVNTIALPLNPLGPSDACMHWWQGLHWFK